MTTEPLRIDPLAVPIPEAVRLSGISRSELYRRLATGQVLAVKSGSAHVDTNGQPTRAPGGLAACDLPRAESRLKCFAPAPSARGWRTRGRLSRLVAGTASFISDWPRICNGWFAATYGCRAHIVPLNH